MSAVLSLQSVSFSYPKRKALNGICFRVEAGEKIALVGPNGAGKTTLFLITAGVLDGYEGEVLVAGHEPGQRSQDGDGIRDVGIVFQNTEDQLFHTTVFDDIAFGPLNLGLDKEIVHQRVHSVMETVGLNHDLETEFPLHLSGGQRRRVALAGVLAMEPKMLLLDEPSSDLDPRGRRELVNLLNSLEITKVISSHNMDLVAETCSRALVLDGGELVADGPIQDVLGNRDLMMKHGLEVPAAFQ